MSNLTPTQKGALRAQIVKVAQANIGQHEDAAHENKGPFVTKLLAFVGLGPGYAWCMAFAVWVVFQVTQFSTLKKTAGVQDQVDHAKTLGVCVSADDVRSGKATLQPGDLMCEYGLSGGYWHYDHTGMVTAVARDGSFISCEGNSNSDGSREGYEVCEHHRNIADVVQTDKGPHAKYCFIKTL